uniref:BTB domain-containing protein n=1 Tax=Glossina brevipalpis TaxID=37001 RepID=A0A1A9WR12_9MUSC
KIFLQNKKRFLKIYKNFKEYRGQKACDLIIFSKLALKYRKYFARYSGHTNFPAPVLSQPQDQRGIHQLSTYTMDGPPPGPSLGEAQTYCLRWNLHQSNLVDILDVLYKRENYVDCTIIVDDNEKFKAHRVVLAANSPYFHSILQDVPGEHCSIIFPGVKKYEMEALLEYMYTGEVDVTQSLIPRIMRIAEELKVKGLFDMADLKEKFNKPNEECNERQINSNRCTRAMSPDVLYRSPASTSSNCAQNPRITKDNDNLDHQPHESSLISTSSNISPSSTQNFGLMAPVPGGQWTMSPSSAAAAMINSVCDPGNDIHSLKHTAEVSSFSHLVNGEDTPILRNVLGHSNPADSYQSLPLVLPSTSAAATAAAAKGDVSSSAHMVGQSSHGFSLNGSDYSSDRQPDHHSQLPQQQHDEQHSPLTDRSFDDEGTYANRSSSSSYDSNLNNAPTGNQKPEWKRYKQYTRNDIMSAIQCVKQGMTALQASRKFGVPSRTLYDKVKKLGITTGRPMNRTLKRSPTNVESSAAFPYAHTYGQTSTSVAIAAAAAMHDANRESSELKDQLQRPSEPPHHLPQTITHPTLLDRAFLQQALESRGGGDIAGREALHAMALAKVAQAVVNHISTNPGANGNAARSPSPATFPLIKYCSMHIDDSEGLVERSISGNNLERPHQTMEIDDDNHAQDLTVNRKIIKSPSSTAVEQREQRSLSINTLPAASQSHSSQETERTVIMNTKLPLNLSDDFMSESTMKREVIEDTRTD